MNTEKSFTITRIFEAKDFGHNDDDGDDDSDDDDDDDEGNGCGDVLIVIDVLIGDRLCGQPHE